MAWRVIQGNAFEELKKLEPESVHCCITSPPYWGLRDYKTIPQVWNGDPKCEHEWSNEIVERKRGSLYGKNAQVGNTRSGVSGTEVHQGQFCRRCGAWLGELGLEPILELYVQHLVEIFREVRRVLRKDGTLWLNLGDCYAGSGKGSGGYGPLQKTNKGSYHERSEFYGLVPIGLKLKDLIGIPWRVAFALQADGWYLRSDIIWAKPNAMPESVKDRPTKAHEYIFLLAKSKQYFYDADAIREPISVMLHAPGWKMFDEGLKRCDRTPNSEAINRIWGNSLGRNKRSVWWVATETYPKAHFATFPEKLVEPCILAGCPPNGVVLDPFAGSGTTLAVAERLGRHSIGIELNPQYVELIKKRMAKVQWPLIVI